MGWKGGSRGRGTYVHSGLIRVVVWQKPTQHSCKAIILQLKTNLKKKALGFLHFNQGYSFEHKPLSISEYSTSRCSRG